MTWFQCPLKQDHILWIHLRNRKLLLHKKEIRWFDDKVKRDGYTIVPTRVYLKKGKCKMEIALAKGKKLYDKREDIKQRDIKRGLKNGGDNLWVLI